MSIASETHPPKPVTLELCELGMAAANLGQNIVLGLTEYPPIIIRKLWKQATPFFGNRVCSIHIRKDVTKLEKNVNGCGLVLVHNSALLEEVAWIVSMSDPISNARPCIIAQTVAGLTPEELPIPTLNLNCTPDEERSLMQWISASVPAMAWSPDVETDFEFEFAPQVLDLFSSTDHTAKGWSNRQLVKALLLGKALCSSEANSIIGKTEYTAVRRLLCSEVVAGGDSHVDPLALAMVNRANVYLNLIQVCADGAETLLSPSRLHDLQRIRGGQTKKDLITRRELVDLGNPNGTLLRNIVDRLSESSDGYSIFQQLGLSRPCPPEMNWRALAGNKKLSLLRSWSYKQVRTHFEALHRQKLIGGERESANGSWQYRLPESLSQVIHRFHWLPKPEEVFSMSGIS